MDTIAVFKSRSEALRLLNTLSRARISCTTINTPSVLNLGCGLSVVFSAYMKKNVGNIISSGGYKTFVGFFDK